MVPTYHDIEAVKYYWREWYVKAVDLQGRIHHWGPWNSRTAADYLVAILARRRTATTDESSGKLESA